MTPQDKRRIFIGSVILFVIFTIASWYMSKEPAEIFDKVSGDFIDYHSYCQKNSICCTHCLFWFSSIALMLMGAYYFLQKFFSDPKEYRERAVYAMIVLLLGLFLSDTILAIMSWKFGDGKFNPKLISGTKIVVSLAVIYCSIINYRKERVLYKQKK